MTLKHWFGSVDLQRDLQIRDGADLHRVCTFTKARPPSMSVVIDSALPRLDSLPATGSLPSRQAQSIRAGSSYIERYGGVEG